jgi:hypothetical protein
MGGAGVINQGTLQAVNSGNIAVTNLAPNTGVLKAGAGSTIAVTGNFGNAATGNVSIDVGGTAVSQFGRLTATGAATLGGIMNLGVVNGFSPSVGNSFQIMTFASRTRQFDVINGLTIGNGNKFNAAYSDTNLTLSVALAGGGGAPPRFTNDLDSDGDGVSDEREIVAGTNPFDASSVFRVSSIEPTANGLEVTFNSVNGKTYRLEFSPDLSAGSWRTVGDPIDGNGHPLKLSDPKPPKEGRGFYHIAVDEPGDE